MICVTQVRLTLYFSLFPHSLLQFELEIMWLLTKSFDKSTLAAYIIQVMFFESVLPCSKTQIVYDKINKNEVITF